MRAFSLGTLPTATWPSTDEEVSLILPVLTHKDVPLSPNELAVAPSTEAATRMLNCGVGACPQVLTPTASVLVFFAIAAHEGVQQSFRFAYTIQVRASRLPTMVLPGMLFHAAPAEPRKSLRKPALGQMKV